MHEGFKYIFGHVCIRDTAVLSFCREYGESLNKVPHWTKPRHSYSLPHTWWQSHWCRESSSWVVWCRVSSLASVPSFDSPEASTERNNQISHNLYENNTFHIIFFILNDILIVSMSAPFQFKHLVVFTMEIMSCDTYLCFVELFQYSVVAEQHVLETIHIF